MTTVETWDELPIRVQNEYRAKATWYYDSGYIDYDEIDDIAIKLWMKDENIKQRSN